MLTHPRALVASLALAASAALVLSPTSAAQSESGSLDSGSLGSAVAVDANGSFAPLGSLGSSVGTRVYPDYVALGDSYAALGDQTQLVSAANQCGNSLTNYPHQLDANPRVGTMNDVSCGGAKVPGVMDPQINALSPDTDLVTLSIGGNDAGFANIVGCLTRQGPYAEMDPTWTCEFAINGLIQDNIAATFAAGGPVDQLYTAIEQRAPFAKVVATQYMPLFPATDPAPGSCPFVDMFHASDTDMFHASDIQWARNITAKINAAVDAAAERNGHDSVLPTDTVDRSACAPADQRWTDFQGGAPTNAAAMHPTTLGQQAMAAAIAAAI